MDHEMKKSADAPLVDRRWHPTDDPMEWIQRTRDSIFESVKRCVSRAMSASPRDESPPNETVPSDAVFRELHVCTQAYSRALYALGQNADGAAALILAAAKQASRPEPLHHSVATAIEQWCREEARGSGPGARDSELEVRGSGIGKRA
jgi:hypothetical protein